MIQSCTARRTAAVAATALATVTLTGCCAAEPEYTGYRTEPTVADTVAAALTPVSVGGLIITAVGAFVALTSSDDAPAGRDPKGPAVLGAKTRHRAKCGFALTVAVVGALPLLAGLGGIIAAVITLVVAGLLAAAAVGNARDAAAYAYVDEQWQVANAAHLGAPLPPAEPIDPAFAGLGLDLAKPEVPERKPLPEPHMTSAEARRVAAVGAGVTGDVPVGSALDVLTDKRGGHGPAAAALASAVKAFGVGETTTDSNGNSRWVPHLTLHSVRAAGAAGDAEVRIRPATPTITVADLAKVEAAFLREARIASATPWEREVASGLFLATVTTGSTPTAPPSSPAPAPAPERDDPADWL